MYTCMVHSFHTVTKASAHLTKLFVPSFIFFWSVRCLRPRGVFALSTSLYFFLQKLFLGSGHSALFSAHLSLPPLSNPLAIRNTAHIVFSVPTPVLLFPHITFSPSSGGLRTQPTLLNNPTPPSPYLPPSPLPLPPYHVEASSDARDE